MVLHWIRVLLHVCIIPPSLPCLQFISEDQQTLVNDFGSDEADLGCLEDRKIGKLIKLSKVRLLLMPYPQHKIRRVNRAAVYPGDRITTKYELANPNTGIYNVTWKVERGLIGATAGEVGFSTGSVFNPQEHGMLLSTLSLYFQQMTQR